MEEARLPAEPLTYLNGEGSRYNWRVTVADMRVILEAIIRLSEPGADETTAATARRLWKPLIRQPEGRRQ